MQQITSHHRQLVGILRDRAVRELPEPVQLASGAWSSHFVDGKEALAAWTDLRTACLAIAGTVTARGHRFDAVGGPTMGADALAVGIAAVCDRSWFFVRKQPKSRGTRRSVEGAQIGPGDKVLLVDDVVTTGGSIMHAFDIIENQGASIVAVATLVDRGDSAGPQLEKRAVDYFPMATYKDLNIPPVRSV